MYLLPSNHLLYRDRFSKINQFPSRQISIDFPENMEQEVAFISTLRKCSKINLVIPFIPNLLRLLYLLMRTNITMRKTQPKPARPTAIDIYRKKAVKQSIEFKEELQPFDFLDRKNILLQTNLLQDSSPHLQVLELQEIEKTLLN